MSKTNSAPLERLFEVIESRKGADPKASYTAKLFEKGRGEIAGKLGEEAIETVIALLSETPGRVVSESADLLYHLLVVWAEAGVRPEDVWAELERREGTSGLDEKAGRSRAD